MGCDLNIYKFEEFYDSLIKKHYDYQNPEYVIEELKKYNERNNNFTPESYFNGMVNDSIILSRLPYHDARFKESFVDCLLSSNTFQTYKNEYFEIKSELQKQKKIKIYELISLFEKIRDNNNLYLTDYHLKKVHQIFSDLTKVDFENSSKIEKLDGEIANYKVIINNGKLEFIDARTTKEAIASNYTAIIGCFIPLIGIIVFCLYIMIKYSS